jgi:hypothetical protein
MMLASLLRLSALTTVIATVVAGYAARSIDDGPRFSIEGPAIFDISAVATSTPDSLRGVEVIAEDVCVSELADRGFWVRQDQDAARVFVHAAEGGLVSVRVGEVVTVHGEVRLATSPLDAAPAVWGTGGRAASRPMPYVYAYTVRPAWPRGNQAGAQTRSDMCASPQISPAL